MVLQNIPMLFADCLLKRHHHKCRQSHDAESSCSGDSSDGSGSMRNDDEREKVYWANLVQKAINHKNDDVSSTQGESEVSSSIFSHKEKESAAPDALGTIDNGRMQEQAVGDSGAEKEESNVKPYTTTMEESSFSAPMKTIPFVSIDVQKWDAEHYDSTERAQIVDDEDDDDDNHTNAEVGMIREVVATATLMEHQICSSSLNSPGHNSSPTPIAAAVWTPCVVSTKQQSSFPTPSTIPSQIYISYDENCIDSSSTTASIETEHVTLQTEILDPTEPLFYDSLDLNYISSELVAAADVLYGLLTQHLHDPDNSCLQTAIVECIQNHPDACQVRYAPTTTETKTCVACYPLSYFCATGCLRAVQAAYAAFPEAIGCADACLGMPLHYACHHAANMTVVKFLLQVFADAVRRTNDRHQTPLHLTCCLERPDPAIISLLLEYYPTAAQLPDHSGYTPLHRLCGTADNASELLPLLFQTSPMTVSAVTVDMQKPLHVAAEAGAGLTVVELLLEQDPAQCRYTDESFQTPLHKAVLFACKHCLTAAAAATHNFVPEERLQQLDYESIELLVVAFPDAVHWTDINDETPMDIVRRMLGQQRRHKKLCAALLRLLQPTLS